MENLFLQVVTELMEVAGRDVVELENKGAAKLLKVREYPQGPLSTLVQLKNDEIIVSVGMASSAASVAEVMYLVSYHIGRFTLGDYFYHDEETGEVSYGEKALNKYTAMKEAERLYKHHNLNFNKPKPPMMN